MAETLTTEVLERLQELQRLHRANKIQQAAALHQPQTNASAAQGVRRRCTRQPNQPMQPRKPRQPFNNPALEQMVTDAGSLNSQNRHAYKIWYRGHKHTLRADLASVSARMSYELATYGISDPETSITTSTGDELRDLLQRLPTNAERLALFDFAMRRQVVKRDISDDKVAVFNTVNGRIRDMPLSTV